MKLIISSFPPKKCGVAHYTENLVSNINNKKPEVDILPWNYSGWHKQIAPLLYINKLKKAVKDNELIHVQYELGLFGFLFLPIFYQIIKKLKGKPPKILITVHEAYNPYKKLRLATFWVKRFHYYWFKKIATLLILHTEHHYQSLPANLKQKSTVIPHPLPEQKTALKRIKEAQYFAVPGFINYWKGHDLLIRAVKEVVAKGNSISVIFLGKCHDRRYAKRLRKMIENLKLQNSIKLGDEFLSPEAYRKALAKAKGSILPYREATMSGVLADCIALEIPCLMSDLDVFSEYTQNEALYFEKNNYKDLAIKLEEFVKNGRLREKQKIAWRKLSKEYGGSNISRKYLALYKKALAGKL